MLLKIFCSILVCCALTIVVGAEPVAPTNSNPTTAPTTRPVRDRTIDFAPTTPPTEQFVSLVKHADVPAYVPAFAVNKQVPALLEERAQAMQYGMAVDPRVAYNPIWRCECGYVIPTYIHINVYGR